MKVNKGLGKEVEIVFLISFCWIEKCLLMLFNSWDFNYKLLNLLSY